VLLYTDGVVEAMRADDAMFGQDRLRAIVAEAPADPEALLTQIVDEVAAFTGRPGREFEDDLTLVAVTLEG
jgi:serine phosphatase RsbU (regulator of sigma subunit)